jgi:hypothetical protein
MSVSAIYGNMAGEQINSSALSGMQRNVQPQKLDNSSYVPFDGDAFQQSGSASSAGSSLGDLSAVQQAYQSLQQMVTGSPEINNTNLPTAGKPVGPAQESGGPVREMPVTGNLGPKEVSGGPVRQTPVTTNPAPIEVSGGPVRQTPVSTAPNPIEVSGSPVRRDPTSGTNSPHMVQAHDPLLPRPGTTVSVVA